MPSRSEGSLKSARFRKIYSLTGPFVLEMVVWGTLVFLALGFSFQSSEEARRLDLRIQSLSRISNNITSLIRVIQFTALERVRHPGLLSGSERRSLEGLFLHGTSVLQDVLKHAKSLSPQDQSLLERINRREIPVHRKLLEAIGTASVLSVISNTVPRLTFPLLNLSSDINGDIHLFSLERQGKNREKQFGLLAGMGIIVAFFLRTLMYLLGGRRKEEIYLRWAFERTSDLVVLLDQDGCFLYANPSFFNFFSSLSGDLIGRYLHEPGLEHEVIRIMREQWGFIDGRDHEIYRRNTVLEGASGDRRWYSAVLTPVKAGKSGVWAYEWHATDFTAQKKVESEIESQREWLRTTLDSITDGVIAMDSRGNITFMNKVSRELIGVSEEEAFGRPVKDVFRIVNEKTQTPIPVPLEGVLMDYAIPVGDIPTALLLPDGSMVPVSNSVAPIRNRQGEVIGAVFVFQEITERKRAQEALWNMTYHDHLTGLPNDLLFRDRLSMAISSVRASGGHLAVFVLDVDHFKKINDALGHTKGNEVIQALSRTLASLVKTGNTLTRLGGDEFLILQLEFDDLSEVSGLAKEILGVFKKPVFVGDHPFNLSVSIGISVFPSDGETPDELIKNADAAMNSVKGNGRNNFRFYSMAMNDNAIFEIRMKDDLVRAIECDQLLLFYQPKVDGRTGSLAGVEALVRWKTEERGFMVPQDFIPIAEEQGILPALGEWVLRRALKDGCRWQEMGSPVSVSVNVSIRQLVQTNFCEQVMGLLAETGFDRRYLELEVTETVFAREFPEIQEKLRFLSDRGIGISLDDFGTGYASLSYLSRFPIQEIKIDQSFIARMLSEPREAEIVKAILSFGRALGLSIVAEGVEKREQALFLLQNDCYLLQGFFFSPAVPFEKFTGFFQKGFFRERLMKES
ncbi:MAG: putative bifunctional diguanylate cyclase/phosphodiesterase [Leptospirales bacterium]